MFRDSRRPPCPRYQPESELTGGVQEAGFRGMIDENVSSVSKSYHSP